MCSLEHNKNAGNLVVRRDGSTRPSFRREQINCCPEEQRPGEAYENIDAHEVEHDDKGVEGGLKLQYRDKRQRQKQGS